jgi:hypothetical protein
MIYLSVSKPLMRFKPLLCFEITIQNVRTHGFLF